MEFKWVAILAFHRVAGQIPFEGSPETGRFRDARRLPVFASCLGRTSRPRLPSEDGQTHQKRDNRDDRSKFRVNGGGDNPQSADDREGLPDPDRSEVRPAPARLRQPGVGGEGRTTENSTMAASENPRSGSM